MPVFPSLGTALRAAFDPNFLTSLKIGVASSPLSADGKAINDAMRAIEADNEDLKDVLPRTYNRLDKDLLVSLLKSFAAVPMETWLGMWPSGQATGIPVTIMEKVLA